MIRYVVVGLGDLEVTPEEADLEVVKTVVEATGFKATILSESTSRMVTARLIDEAVR